MVIVYMFATVFVLLLCAIKLKLMRFLSLANKIPGPSFWKLFQESDLVLNSRSMLYYLCNMCESYGYKPWGFWFYGDLTVVVSDAKSIEDVFKSKNTFNRPKLLYGKATKYYGYGLFSLNGAEYRRHRKRIEPMFRKSVIESCMLPYVNDYASKLVQHYLSRKDASVLNALEDHMVALTFSILTLDSCPDLYPDSRHYCRISHNAMSMIQLESVKPLFYLCWFKWQKSAKLKGSAVLETHNQVKNIMLQVKDTLKNKGDSSNPLEKIMQTFFEEFTDEELFAEFKTLVISLFETTAFTVSACLILLALHPEVQHRVFQEVESIFGQGEHLVDPEHLSKMVYLETVIKETLRLFPPGPLISRRADEDILVSGILVPEGTTIIIDIMALHRNGSVFKDPLKFDPDRFSGDVSKERGTFSYIPFSYGGRGCPGQQLGTTTAKIFLSQVVRKFEILPSEDLKRVSDVKVKLNITMAFSEQVSLRLVNRYENES